MTEPQSYREYWEEWAFYYRSHSAATRELQTRSDTQAAEFAKMLIQVLALLHGGALVALPTFFQVFDLSFSGHRLAFWSVFTVLLIGLLSAAVAGLFAFFALASRAEGNMKLLEAYQHRAWAHVFTDQGNRLMAGGKYAEADQRFTSAGTSSDEAGALGVKAAPLLKKYETRRWRGIVSLVTSLAMFVVAAVLGSLLLALPSCLPITKI